MPDPAEWGRYHATNGRTTRLAELWARPAIQYLLAHSGLAPESAVLDFGCGYFELGVALAPHVRRMDGLEIDDASLKLARSRSEPLPDSTIHAKPDDVPAGAYDLIVANSVFQYLGDEAGLIRTLKQFRGWLKPGGRGEVLLIDLIPRSYSPHRDALRSMWVAATNGAPFSMARFLWKAATNPDRRRWLLIDPPRLGELASECGFTCERYPRNLTPSLQRYSCRLRLA